jgi:hypothetical protein
MGSVHTYATEFQQEVFASFMFGDESEEIQCASSQNQGAFLYSRQFAARVCAALQYTIVDSVPITGRNGCSSNDGLIFTGFLLEQEEEGSFSIIF